MARKNVHARESLSARVENPFIHVPFQAKDLSSIERGGGGGGTELAVVDDAYRAALSKALFRASTALSREQTLYPQALSHLVLKLRDTGIAKSHRPVQLAREAELEPAGHARIDEMLVGATSSSFTEFNRVILKRDTRTIRSNLSAIESIEPWDRKRRNPQGSKQLLDHGRAVMRLFQYQHDSLNELNYESVLTTLKSLSLPFIEIAQGRGLPIIGIQDLDGIGGDGLDVLLDFPGIRTIYAEPFYLSQNTVVVPQSGASASKASAQEVTLPTVAVFDTGVSRDRSPIAAFLKSQDIYVLPPDTNHEHGTAVASLIAAGSFYNDKHAWIPKTPAFIHDVCALEATGAHMSDLELRLQEAVRRRPDVKIWNLSVGGDPCDESNFSDLSMTLDELSDKYQVLFVVAAGNYNDLPRRNWPTPVALKDRISTPGESVRSLTVASVAHIDATDGLTAAGNPAPYSRCGPGPVFTPKPDLTHVGGGVHAPWSAGTSSLKVLAPQGHLYHSFGTSYAAPLASCMAAHAWQALAGLHNPNPGPSPSLVKALMIHSAQLASPDYDSYQRRYFGAGRPDDVLRALYDSDDCFTLVFQANLVPGNMRWRKSPYPMPDVLIEDEKFCGEIIITAVYAPPLDPNAGSEYVRANVELSFGTIEGDNITGKVPMESEEGQSGYETAQISSGNKWSPVKVHRKAFPRGVAGKIWGLQATALLRAYEPALTEALPVHIIVTIRSLDGDLRVRASGMRALAQSNWVNTPLPLRVPINVINR